MRLGRFCPCRYLLSGLSVSPGLGLLRFVSGSFQVLFGLFFSLLPLFSTTSSLRFVKKLSFKMLVFFLRAASAWASPWLCGERHYRVYPLSAHPQPTPCGATPPRQVVQRRASTSVCWGSGGAGAVRSLGCGRAPQVLGFSLGAHAWQVFHRVFLAGSEFDYRCSLSHYAGLVKRALCPPWRRAAL